MRVVCLHGLGRTPADWDGVRGALSELGPVVTPALPGDSARALALADAAVEPGDVVVGHSMGGVLAQRLVRERPRALRAAVLTGCFFRPARNGRGLRASLADYASHRVAFVRGRGAGAVAGGERPARALLSLAALAVRPGGLHEALEAATTGAVLVVHARDDHHVPLDFALAAGWETRILETGGHHAHVTAPGEWLAAVLPWLASVEDRAPRLA